MGSGQQDGGQYGLQGTPYMYQREEIGMTNLCGEPVEFALPAER
ncbi:MAG: hypothetical protein ACRCWL_00700 [Aeromonas sp.]